MSLKEFKYLAWGWSFPGEWFVSNICMLVFRSGVSPHTCTFAKMCVGWLLQRIIFRLLRANCSTRISTLCSNSCGFQSYTRGIKRVILFIPVCMLRLNHKFLLETKGVRKDEHIINLFLFICIKNSHLLYGKLSL